MFKLEYLMLVFMAFCACRKEKFQLPPLITSCIPKESIMDSITPITVWYPDTDIIGRAVAIKTNKKWEASASIARPDNADPTFLVMTFDTYSSRSIRKEVIRFYNFPSIKGCYTIGQLDGGSNYEGLSASYLRLDDDAILNGYAVDTLSRFPNKIEILEFDSISNTVNGLFAVSFKIRFEKLWPEDPDSVRFFNGFFEAKIE